MTCTPYEQSYSELVLPNIQIFSELCVSYDKTKMFNNTLFRLLFYWILSMAIEKYFQKTTLMINVYLVLTIIIYINLLSIFIIVVKKPKYET